jgi:phosphoserine phosphatase
MNLEDEYKDLDGQLDHMLSLNEAGLDVDMVRWYDTIGKMESIQRRLATIQHLPVETVVGLYRANKLNAELHALVDPFEAHDSQPDVEPEYDPALEWFLMTEELRRGEG